MLSLENSFRDKSGVHIPAYVNVSTQVSMPEYDPSSPDILLKDRLRHSGHIAKARFHKKRCRKLIQPAKASTLQMFIKLKLIKRL